MHPHSTTATLDATLAAFVAARPLTGRPRPQPLVRGVLIITRLSQAKERMSSLTMQERHCREYVKNELGGMPVLDVYQDIKSGLIPGMARAGYLEAMTRARMRLASHIVVYDYDRFSRERVSSLKDYEDMERLGVELHDTLSGYISHEVAGQKAVAAEEEARKNSRRTFDNMMERHMNAEDYDSPRRAPFGFQKGSEPSKPVKHPQYADVVTQMFQRYDSGESAGQLRAWFNNVTGRRVRTSTITEMLRNEYYAGIDIYNKRSRSKVHGRHRKERDDWSSRRHDQPVIDMATFERVQAKLDQHAQHGQARQTEAHYALRGLVKCASCGQHCAGDNSNRHGDGRMRCPHCRRARSHRRLEGVLQAKLREIPLSLDHVGRKVRKQVDVVPAVERVTQRIEAVRNRRARLYEQRADAEAGNTAYWDEEAWQLSWKATQQELMELEAQRDGIVTNAKVIASTEQTLAWLHDLSNWTEIVDPEQTTPAQRNRVYQRCVAVVMLDFGAETVRIDWQPAIARLLARDSDSVPLPSQKARVNTN